MTFGTRHREMRSLQRKSAFLMLRDGIRGRLESSHDVALFTLALVGSRGKLPLVHIGMAIHAFGESDLVARRCTGGKMAFRAGHLSVAAQKRVCGRRVRVHIEERRLPSIHVVARRAFSLVRPLGKLASVRIGCVAISAMRESDRLLEISSRVALQAVHLRMLAEQRIFRLRVVESLGLRNVLPSARGVARFAGLRKRAVMRIGMAIGALRERNAGESRLAVRRRGSMALRTGNLSVQAGQRVMGFRMIEIRRRLPIYEIVTLQTIRTQATVMDVLVARDAILR